MLPAGETALLLCFWNGLVEQKGVCSMPGLLHGVVLTTPEEKQVQGGELCLVEGRRLVDGRAGSGEFPARWRGSLPRLACRSIIGGRFSRM